MDDDAREELRRLRARAYGPDADIADDPSAAERLSALEERDREERSPAPMLPIVAEEPVASGSVALGPEVVAEEGDEEAEGEEVPRERRPLIGSKRALWVWALSLAVVTALASAATALSLTFVPVARSVGAPQVGTLEPDPDTEPPAIFGQRTGAERAFRSFYGVTAFVGFAQVDATENRSPCIYLLDSAEVTAQEAQGSAATSSTEGAVRASSPPPSNSSSPTGCRMPSSNASRSARACSSSSTGRTWGSSPTADEERARTGDVTGPATSGGPFPSLSKGGP